MKGVSNESLSILNRELSNSEMKFLRLRYKKMKISFGRGRFGEFFEKNQSISVRNGSICSTTN